MKRLKGLCLIFCMCAAVFAGEKGLSRGQAAKILKKEFAQQGVYSYETGGYAIWEDTGSWNLGTVKALDEAGLIRYRYVEKFWIAKQHTIVVGPLTDEGKKHFVRYYHDGGHYFTVVKLADKTLVRITGIRSDSNSALVEYEWKYTNVTPFGRILTKYGNGFKEITGKIREGKKRFSHYDDGWRID